MVVTVADTGLDNGINNSGMHPDFKDHIKGIFSLPIPASRCTWTGGSPGSCDDGASDTDGHGTHVAGSAVGDGTLTSTNAGIAPEAQLLFHAIGQGAPGSLSGIPNNVGDMFDMAVANGSRIHTNSWGSCFVDSLNNCNDWGRYTARSAQIDSSARTNDELVILFAAGNDGADTNADNDNEQDTLSFESTSKNAIIIGASENFRPSSGWPSDNISGLAYFSSIGPADDGRTKPDFLAPGTAILSTRSRSSAGTGNYEQLQGTSMATPIAAGSTALLLQHPVSYTHLTLPTKA